MQCLAYLLTNLRLLCHLPNRFIIICEVGRVRHTSTCHKRINITQRSQYYFKYSRVAFNFDKVTIATIKNIIKTPWKP